MVAAAMSRQVVVQSAPLRSLPGICRRRLTDQCEEVADRELMVRLCQDDPTALGVLYDRYRDTAIGLAVSIVRDRDTAEDIVHDAFLSVWQQARRYDPRRGSPRAWLLTIVHNRGIDRLRRQAVRRAIALTPDLVDTRSPDPADTAADWVLVTHLRAALWQLPEQQRRTIELAFLHGRTHAEIATLMDCPVGTVKGRIRIGMAKLRAIMIPPQYA